MSLPNTYKQLNGVCFPSGSYVNTGIVPSNHKTEILVYDYPYVNDKHWVGTDQSGGGAYYHFTTFSNKYYWGLNGSEANTGAWVQGLHHLIYNGDNYSVILDGTTLGSGSAISSGSELYIGRRSGASNFTGWVIYFKLADKTTNELVADYIPCKRISDGVVGFYDNVSGTFKTNNGSGTFYGYEINDNGIDLGSNATLPIVLDDNASITAHFSRSANCRFKVNGEWKFAMMYVKVNGQWQQGLVRVKKNGSWKEGG